MERLAQLKLQRHECFNSLATATSVTTPSPDEVRDTGVTTRVATGLRPPGNLAGPC